ncbi:hypothetical protein QCA22_000141 [Salmonella enterica]|nr:hypothetical protein [Salmonella enterica]EKS5825466.1 hypothetical protein [Salmonella enterica]EKS5879981.1 hypothetical protein [Salmonella enterica]EKS5984193.1 hypothetical protein [Salmonella enterica]
MANSWLRLWHDMPNDPKWRTIARKSSQRIGDVISVYLHVLVNVSSGGETMCNAGVTQDVTQGNEGGRGRIKNLCADDIASSLDLETEQVEQILAAMQGKVLDGDLVIGWAKRQPKREDDSSARVKAFRDKKKAEKAIKDDASETMCNAGVTQSNAPDTDTDTDTEEELKDQNTLSDFGSNRTAEDNPASPEKPPAPENPEPEQTVVRGSGNSPDPDQEVERTGDSDPPDKPDDREKPCEPDPVDLAFGDIFWKAGLCKVGKVKACSAFRTKYRAWKKSTHGSPPEFASMLASDIRRRLSAGVFGMDKLHPATYLNQERWNDELPTDLASPAGGTTPVRDVSHLTDEQRQELVMYELLEGR